MARTPSVHGPSKALNVTIPQDLYEFLESDRFEPDVRMDRGDYTRMIVTNYAVSRGYVAKSQVKPEK